jgi:hypothetical protein
MRFSNIFSFNMSPIMAIRPVLIQTGIIFTYIPNKDYKSRGSSNPSG